MNKYPTSPYVAGNMIKVTPVIPLLLTIFLTAAQCSNDVIVTDVYVPDDNRGVILFDIDDEKSRILIEDTTSVFFVMQTSSTNDWAVVSKMPADPDEAHGSNEEKLLFYVPQKRAVYHPEYGDKAYLIAIETEDGAEKAQWLVDGQTLSVTLDSLRKICLGDTKACSASSINRMQKQKDHTIDDSVQQSTAQPFSLDGWLRLGISHEVVINRLGKPKEKGSDLYWGATGTYNQQWHYPEQGISLLMESDTIDAPKTVSGITIASPSDLKNEKSIGIGADYETVKSAYADRIDWKSSNEETLVVGSIYDGIIISFRDDKVASIFVGAAAE